MKNKKFEGKTLDYKNPSASDTILSGAIVELPSRICVAVADISPLKTGSVEMEGVFELPKASGESMAFGDDLYVNGSGNLTKTAEDNTYAGICADAEGRQSAETKVLCRLGDARLVVNEA